MTMKNSSPQATEQERYANVLHWGTLVGFLILVGTFLVYVTGMVAGRVPSDQLPHLWTLSATDYIRATGTPQGWHWVEALDKGDFLSLTGIAILSACPMVSIAAVIPVYLRERNFLYAAICFVTVGVLLYSASGIELLHHR